MPTWGPIICGQSGCEPTPLLPCEGDTPDTRFRYSRYFCTQQFNLLVIDEAEDQKRWGEGKNEY